MAKKRSEENTIDKSKFLTPDQIRDSLWEHGWLNNTLSPISTKVFWDFTKNIVPYDEIPYSAILAQSNAGSFIHKQYVFLATDQRVLAIINTAGVITTKEFAYDEVTAIDLYVDYWLKSLIYCDMYLTKFRYFKLETNDPTSSTHFRDTILSIQKNPRGKYRFKPVAGTVKVTMKATKFLIQKLTYLIMWRSYHKNLKKENVIKSSKQVKQSVNETIANEQQTTPTKKVSKLKRKPKK